MGSIAKKYKTWIIIGVIVLVAVIVWKMADSGKLAVWVGTLGTFFKSIFTKNKKSEEDHNNEVQEIDDQITALQSEPDQKDQEYAALTKKEGEVKEQIDNAAVAAREEVSNMDDKELHDYLNNMFD